MLLKTAPQSLFLASALFFASCGNNNAPATEKINDSASLSTLKFTIEQDTEWTNLFVRKKGWFGGDGIFAVSKNGVEKEGASTNDEIMIWFSDTMFGDIIGDSLQPGFGMINNSIAILQGNKPDSAGIKFIWDKTSDNKPKSIFIPNTPQTGPKDYYWLGDGFINHQKNNDFYMFGYRVRNTDVDTAFGFQEVGNTLIHVPSGSIPPFADKKQVDIPFFQNMNVDSTGSFGAGVLVNTNEAGALNPDGFIYVYGVRGKQKNVMIARVLPENIDVFDKWTFWNGSDWSSDPKDIQTVTDRTSNELSVSPLPDGRYAMVFQLDGLGSFIGLRLGATPWGPFGPVIKVYDVSKDLEEDKDIFPYNAKAHPVLSQPGELLISYNVNSFDFWNDVKVFPHLYRPRFIKLKYDLN